MKQSDKNSWDRFVKAYNTNFSKDANGIKYEFYEEDLLNFLQTARKDMVSEILKESKNCIQYDSDVPFVGLAEFTTFT